MAGYLIYPPKKGCRMNKHCHDSKFGFDFSSLKAQGRDREPVTFRCDWIRVFTIPGYWLAGADGNPPTLEGHKLSISGLRPTQRGKHGVAIECS